MSTRAPLRSPQSCELSPHLSLPVHTHPLVHPDNLLDRVLSDRSENFEKPAAPSLLVQYIHFVNKDVTLGAQFGRSLEESPKVRETL